MARARVATNCPPHVAAVRRRAAARANQRQSVIRIGLVIHPDLIWLAVAFVTVMAGMLAAAPE